MSGGIKDCSHYLKLICEYVDSELSEELSGDFMEHIQSCEKCRKMFRSYCMTITLSRKTKVVHTVSTEQMERLCAVICSRMGYKK